MGGFGIVPLFICLRIGRYSHQQSFASPRFPSIVQCFFLRNYHFLSQLIFHHAAPLFFDRDTLDDKKGSVSFIDPKTVDIV